MAKWKREPVKRERFAAREVADQLGVSEAQVYSNLWRVESVRIGRSIRIDERAIAQLRDFFASRDAVRGRAYASRERDQHRRAATEMMSAIACRQADWTYVVEADLPAALFKIGRARNIVQRLWGLDRGSPVAVHLVALAAGGDFEAVLHDRFADRRVRGEWFSADVGAEIAAAFASRGQGDCLRCALTERCGWRPGGHRRTRAKPT